MLKWLWQWLKSLIKQLFGRKKPIYPPLAAQKTGEIHQEWTDAEYHSLFLQLLVGINNEDWSRGRVKAFLDGNRINQANFVEWLRGFGERLVASPTVNDELVQGMVRLSNLSVGAVSFVAYEIGSQLLKREEKTNPRLVEYAQEETTEKEVIVTSDQLLVMMQQDANLVQQITQQLGIETSDPQVIMKELINQLAADKLTNADAQSYVIQGLKNTDAQANLIQGFQQYMNGEFKGEVVAFEKSIESQLNFHYLPDAWFFKAEALISLGLIEEAIASCEEAIRIKPDYHQGWNWLGSVQCDYLQQYEQAVISFDKAIKLKSDFCEAWINRAEALNKSKRYEEALISCNEALKLECNDKYYEIWNKRGIALSGLNREEEAIASYDKALEIKLDYHHPWQNRASAAMYSISFDPVLSSLSAIAKQNPALNQRGYNGALESFEEGLKYFQQDTHPEGYGILYKALGYTHYLRGQGDTYPHSYWYKAVKSYNKALKTLTAEDFPELHLEILEDLISLWLNLEETDKAEELKRQGTDLLRRLLDECRSLVKKKQLALKFAGFQQLTADLTIQSGNWCAALELAEQGKNACLSWLLYGWSDESPKWEEMKQLLNPNTAIVYWHLSPVALHTFILKHNTPSPIVLRETLITPAQRLYNFEAWVNTWNEEYTNFRQGKDKQSEDTETWRDKLPAMLDKLGKILDINAIVSQILDITQLILIPHRDLHRFPLQALFPPEFIISYLPSLQLGLISQTRDQNQGSNQHQLLSIEHPNSAGYPGLEFAQVESEAICRIFPHNTRKRSEEATKEAVINALAQGYGILHFTGHGEYNFHNPALSHLALADEDKLTLRDIRDFDLRSYQLVSLAACETAITGNHAITTEYVGLVSGFMSCGVAHVVSTLWTVESAASALVMIQFYQRLQQGKSKVVALAEATQWLRNVTHDELAQWYAGEIAKLPEAEGIVRRFLLRHLNNLKNKPEPSNQPYNHPYFWAAFTITGIFPSCKI
ncbi:CHAT domain-containing protein [Nostoc linckia FACHB-104]|nr:CHAT domain-containing protein [Nostoc linckia FACHB-104]